VAGNYASEDFYESGDSTGVEGFGGAQTLTAPVASSADPQVSWSTAETFAPSTSVSSWAGSMVEVDLQSGGTTYSLRYINPFTAASGSYTASPTASNTATVKYVVLSTITSKTWYSQPARDVASDALAQFGLSTFTVTAIDYADLEDATSSGSPYPNMTAYWKNISLQTGTTTGPAPALAESPLTVGLPLVGIGVAAVAITTRRRRRTA
jgi:hypothetical protein